jgi:hypothetical protein
LLTINFISSFPIGSAYLIDGKKQTLYSWFKTLFPLIKLEVCTVAGANNQPESQNQLWQIRLTAPDAASAKLAQQKVIERV